MTSILHYIPYLLAGCLAVLMAGAVFWRDGIEWARLAGLAAIVVMLATGRLSPKALLLNPAFVLLTGFLLAAGLSLLVNDLPLADLNRVLNWMLALLLGLAAALHFSQGVLLRILLCGPLAAVVTGYGMYALHLLGLTNGEYGFDRRLELFSANPNILATIYGVFILVCLGGAVLDSSRKVRIFSAAMGLALIPLLCWTDSRSSILALPPLILLLSLVLCRNWRRVTTFFLAALLLFSAGAWLIYKHGSGQRFAQAITNTWQDPTWQSRRAIYHIGIQAFTEKPIAGHGFNGFKHYYGQNMAKHGQEYRKHFQLIQPVVPNAHNFFLHFLAETGLLGTLLICALWTWVAWRGLSTAGVAAVAATAVLYVMLACQLNMSLYPRVVSAITFTLLGVAATPTLSQRNQPAPGGQPS